MELIENPAAGTSGGSIAVADIPTPVTNISRLFPTNAADMLAVTAVWLVGGL